MTGLAGGRSAVVGPGVGMPEGSHQVVSVEGFRTGRNCWRRERGRRVRVREQRRTGESRARAVVVG